MFLNQCWSVHAITASQLPSFENWRRDEPVTPKKHILCRSQGFFRWLLLSFVDSVARRLAHRTKYGSSQTKEVCWLFWCCGAIADCMDLVETSLDRVPILFRKKLTRQLDRNCVFLADVAHIGRTLYYHGLWTDGGRRDRILALFFH